MAKITLACSFCGKSQADVPKLIAGPDHVAICTECVALCVNIHNDEQILLRPQDARPPMGRMDASWRGDYIATATAQERTDVAAGIDTTATAHCVFCQKFASRSSNQETLIVATGNHSVVILNAYPYSSGHTMVLPRRHIGSLHELTTDEHTELWGNVARASAALMRAYQPEGMNIGANLGKAAGAGIPGHLHVHLVPRWNGDTNFMTAIAETRVVPEAMEKTWQRVNDAWDALN